MIFFWREFSERPRFLLKKYEKRIIIKLKKKEKEKEKEIENIGLTEKLNFFWKEEFNEGNVWKNFYLKRTKKKEKVKTLFLGRIVGIDKNTQYVSISTGIKRDGVYKVAKKTFIQKIQSKFRSETKDEIRFYLPFYNEPHKEALSKRFMKVKLGEMKKKKKRESLLWKNLVWKNWKKHLKNYFSSYLLTNKIQRYFMSRDLTVIRFSRKKTRFVIYKLFDILFEKIKNYKLRSLYEKKYKNLKDVRKKRNEKMFEILLIQRGEPSLNWLKRRDEFYIRR